MLIKELSDEELENEIKKTSLLVSKYNTMQNATKVLANACYGCCGTPFFRFYDLRIAEGITINGQLVITWAGKFINEYLNELSGTTDRDYVVMSDTDSTYINLKDFIPKNVTDINEICDLISGKMIDDKYEPGFISNHITPMLKKRFEELSDILNSKSNRIHMKQEAIANTGIYVAKKKYFTSVVESEGGIRKSPAEIVIKGIEIVRSDTPIAVKPAMKKSINIFLYEDEEALQKHVLEFNKEYMKANYQEVAYPTGVNGLLDYSDSRSIYSKGTPIHVRASLLYNHYIRTKGLSKKYKYIKDKDKIKYVYLKTPNPISENVIAFHDEIPEELGVIPYIDYVTMFDKSFVAPIKRITDSIDWTPYYVNRLF